MSIMDYVIGANAGKAQGEAIERSRSRTAEQIHTIERESLQDTNAHNIEMLAIIVAVWKGRYEREQANRRGWKKHGMAASEIIEKLTGANKDAVEKMVVEHIKQHLARFDAENARVDDLLFHNKQ